MQIGMHSKILSVPVLLLMARTPQCPPSASIPGIAKLAPESKNRDVKEVFHADNCTYLRMHKTVDLVENLSIIGCVVRTM